MANKKYLDYEGLTTLVNGIDGKYASKAAVSSAITDTIQSLDSERSVGADEESGAQQVITGIKITDGKLDTLTGGVLESNDILLDGDINVLGVNVGNLKSGDTLLSGTSITNILKKILVQVKTRSVVSPTTKLTNNTSVTSEVGDSFSRTFTHTYTDGAFTGVSTDGFNPTSIAAGCVEGTTTYSISGAGQSKSNTDGLFEFTVGEGDAKVTCSTAYAASTAENKKNNGDVDSTGIAAGTANSSTSCTITGQYKYYLGYTTALTASEINTTELVKALNTKTGYCTVGGTTTIVGSTAIESNGNSIAIVVPKKYTLKTIQNGLGTNIMPNFSEEGDVTYTNGSTSTTYHIYLYPISSGAKVEFKNVAVG